MPATIGAIAALALLTFGSVAAQPQSQRNVETTRHEETLAALERRLEQDPTPEAYARQAQIQYELERWSEGADSIAEALRLKEASGRQPEEHWYQLAFVLEFELGGCGAAFDRLLTLMRLYPKREYYVQAAGCASRLCDKARQLQLMDLAAASGLLNAVDSFTHAALLMNVQRHEDAKRAIVRGGRLLDAPADAPARARFADAAALIAAQRYSDAKQTLSEGLKLLLEQR